MPTSPSLSSEVAFISGVNANGTLAQDAFYGWDGDYPATYTSGHTDAVKWGAATAGTPGGTVDYYFNPSSNWTSVEEKWLSAGLALWSAVANISFALTTNPVQAQITFTRGSDGGSYTDTSYLIGPNAGVTGGRILDQLTSATISIDTSVAGFGPITGSFSKDGGYPLETFLHEEGHAIGLGHAGPYDGTGNSATAQFSAYDSRLWSVMSYVNPQTTKATYYSQYTVKGTNWGSSSGYPNVPTTWMPADILALETLYGLPTSTPLSGGQTFGFNCNISGAIEPYFDFAINTKPIITIWDEGKNNTLDLSGFSASSAVNLNPGTFSSCDGLTNNLAIAYNTVIDSFIGGSGNDTVVGNNDGDSINAGAGNDTITGGSGNDTFIVGAGNDTLKGGAGNDMFNLGANLIAADKIDGGSGTDTVYLNGNYTGAHAMTFNATTMVHVEKIVLAAGHSYTLTTDDATVAACKTLTIDGSALTGINVLTFNGSAETDGHFIIIGGKGGDKLTGGAGSDTFTYMSASRSTSTHYDTITGFNFSSDIFDTPGAAGTITGIDAKVTSGSLSTASFDTDLAAAMSGHLGAHHAILFKPNAGTFSGDTFLVVDLNGTAGYQSGHDLVIRMISSTGTLAAAGFH